MHHRFNAQNSMEAGLNVDFMNARLFRENYWFSGNEPYINSIDYNGNTFLVQGHVAWQHRFSDQWTLNTGMHYQNLLLNSASQSLEPRLGLRYQFRPSQSVSIAYGRHNQMQPSTIYFVETEGPGNDIMRTNKSLGFTTADHYVIGYNWMIKPDIKLVLEMYYQDMKNIPVEMNPSIFSMVNAGADFGIPEVDSLVNRGTGSNKGIELTLEKYFNKSYYFLVTGSLFDSQYTPSDGVQRNTAFNGNYVFNGLFGKEWKLGKKGNVLAVDLKVTYAGNNRYMPVDLEASIDEGKTVYDESRAFEERYPDYFRMDFKATFRTQHKRVTQEWVLDIQNITNHQNIYTERYNPATQTIATTYQIGMWPMFQYRLLF
jgi:outer membrane receptor protein involved in Fe transport